MVQKVLKQTVEHKRTKSFKRFQSDQFKRIQTTWRKPKGIDNPLRRHYRGRGPMPNIGYGTDKRTRFYDRSGFIRYVVNNAKELEVLLMHNHKYQAVIGQSVGARKRVKLLERARELDIKVANARGKLKTEVPLGRGFVFLWELLNQKNQTRPFERLLKFDFPRGIMFARLFRDPALTYKNTTLFFFGRGAPAIFLEFTIN